MVCNGSPAAEVDRLIPTYTIELARVAPGVVVVPRRARPAIAFFLDEVAGERVDDSGHERRARFRRGDAAFFPAACRERVTWSARAGVLQVHLDGRWFAAEGATGPADGARPSSHCVRASDQLTRELGAALHAATTRRDPDEASVGGIVQVLVEHLQRHCFSVGREGRDRAWSLAVGELVAALHRDPARRYRVSELARAARLTRFELARRFRRTTGMSVSEYLQRARIDRAKALLDEGSMPLAEVALASGFFDQSHFTRVFRRYAGTPPGAFQQAATSRGCAL